MRRCGRLKLSVSPAAVAGFCVFCALDTLGLALPFLLSAVLHELGHLAVLWLLGIPVEEISVRLGGTVIRSELPGGWREVLAAAAGPAVNLLLALACFRCWPPLCLCSLLLAWYNLLPVMPLDGGRLCQLILPRLLGRFGRLLCRALSLATICIAVCAGIWGTCVLQLGLLPALLAVIFLLRLPNGLDKPAPG